MAAAVASAMGQVVSTSASSTQTRRKNSRQHGRVPEQVADRLFVRRVPSGLESGDVGRAADHEAEGERLPGLHRHRRRRVRLTGQADHLDRQRG